MANPLSSISHPVRPFFSGHEQTASSHICGPGIWPHYLLHFVLSGSGTFTCAGRIWHLGTGDAFLIIPGVVSSYASDAEKPLGILLGGVRRKRCGNHPGFLRPKRKHTDFFGER